MEEDIVQPDVRTAKDYLEDMLAHGRDWMAILAVARFVRKGRWHEECKKMLIERGLMPKEEEEIRNQQRMEAVNNKKQEPPKYAISPRIQKH